jgi:hypothetical protein
MDGRGGPSEPGWTVRKISGRHVQRLVDSHLIIMDLQICDRLLDQIETFPFEGQNLTREALAWSLLIKLISCFSSGPNARGPMDENRVFAAGQQMDDYRYFEAVRDKNVAHDVNSMRLLTPVAMIGPAPGYHLDSIQFLDLETLLNYETDVPRLRSLVTTALKYAHYLKTNRQRLVANDLLAMTPSVRAALPNLDGSTIHLKPVNEPR